MTHVIIYFGLLVAIVVVFGLGFYCGVRTEAAATRALAPLRRLQEAEGK